MVSKRVTKSKSLFISSALSFSIAGAISAPVSADYRPYEGGLNDILNLPPAMHLRDPKTVGSAYNPNDHSLLQVIELDGAATQALCNTHEDRDKDGLEDKDHGQAGVGQSDPNNDNYKFVVEPGINGNTNVLIFMEGGGGCWDYMTCSEKGGAGDNAGFMGNMTKFPVGDDTVLRGATRFAMTSWPEKGHDLIAQTTDMLGLDIGQSTPYSEWTKIYLPYCSQDMYVGANTPEYSPDTPENPNVDYLTDYKNWKQNDPNHTIDSLKFRHHGGHIVATVASWIRKNLPQPDKLLVTGQSAGGFASELTYHYFRSTIQPNQGYMFNDAGTFFLAENGYDQNGNVVASTLPKDRNHPQPSSFIHETIVNNEWGHRPYLSWLEAQSAGMSKPFRMNNIGTISEFLSEKWPSDRFMLTTFQRDLAIAGFSYNNQGFDYLDDAGDLVTRNQHREELRMRDIQNKAAQLDSLPNFGYFFPFYRPAFGGHMATISGLNNTTRLNDSLNSADQGKTVRHAIGNLLSTDSLMEGFEIDPHRKDNRPWSDCGHYYRATANGVPMDALGDVFATWRYNPTAYAEDPPEVAAYNAVSGVLNISTGLWDAGLTFFRELIDPCFLNGFMNDVWTSEVGLEPAYDTFTRSGGYANDVYDNSSDLMVKKDSGEYNRHAYLKFKFDHIRNIPSKVTLRFHVGSVGDSTFLLCAANNTLPGDNPACWNDKHFKVDSLNNYLDDNVVWNYNQLTSQPATNVGSGIVYNRGFYDIDVTNRVKAVLNSKDKLEQVFKVSITSDADLLQPDGNHWFKIDSMEATKAPRLLFEYDNNAAFIPTTQVAKIDKPANANVAWGKTAAQSSNHTTDTGDCPNRANTAVNAIDGNTSGNWHDCSVTHTNNEAGAWWEVDLGTAHTLTGVTLWNRSNYSNRLSNFDVDYLDANGNVLKTTTHAGTVGTNVDISLNGSGVHKVRVQLNGSGILSLAEVQAWGEQDMPFYSKTTPPNADGGWNNTNTIYLDRHEPNCATKGLNSFKLYRPTSTQIAYQYTCIDVGDSIMSGWNNTPANDWGGGHNAYLDRHAINCGNKAIKAFRLTRPSGSTIRYVYKCGGNDLSQITDHYTPWNDNGNGDVHFLDRHNVACAAGKALTYARLQNDGNGKIRYHYKCGGGLNIALGKGTTQSSIAHGGEPSRAVDGNTSGAWGNGSVTHTASDSGAWWKVNLNGSHTISGITLWNRTDCCTTRLSNFSVLLSTEMGPMELDYSGTTVGEKLDIPINMSGVYSVKVQLNGSGILSLAEVQVWGQPD